MDEKRIPQVGDIVVWAKPKDHAAEGYDPPPYVVEDYHPFENTLNIKMRNLDGSPLRYNCGLHKGVNPSQVKVDVFLTAAYRANHVKPKI